MKPLALIVALVLAGAPPPFAGAQSASPAAGADGESKVIEYLEAHPEFLLEHPEFVQRAIELQRENVDRVEVAKRRDLMEAESRLLGSVLTPVRGDADATYTLIAFSDYQCEPCRRSYPAVESFVQGRIDLRFVQLQLPIYGPHSTMAARAALLAQERGGFAAFHATMMAMTGPVDLDSIQAALAKAGVPAAEFAARMSDPEFARHLDRVREFSVAADVVGTPAYLLNGVLLNGAVTEHDLHAVIAKLQQQGD